MYNIIDTGTKKTFTVNFDQLNRMVGGSLDEAFFSEAFTAHTLNNNQTAQILVMEE